MSEIRIQGPDGSTFAFPAGTPSDVIEGALRSHYGAAKPAAPQPPEGRGSGVRGTIDAAVRGAADMMTFGMADELSAGLSALTGIGGTFGDYEGNLRRQRAIDTYDAQANPNARLTGQVAGGVAGGLGLAKAGLLATPRMAGRSVLLRYPVAAAEGATLAGLYGAGSAPEGRRLEGAIADAPVGAAFGVVGEAAAPLVSRGVSYVANRVDDLINPQAAQQAKVTLAQVLGVDPAQIPDDVATRFAQQARRAVSSDAAARQSAADEFGIPLTRGQATRDMSQLGFEEAARNEGRGALAGSTVRKFDERQGNAVAAAKTKIAEDLGGPVTTTSQNELAQDVLDGLRSRAGSAKAGVDAAYDAARDAGTVVATDAVQGAGTAVRRILDEGGYIINDVSTPYAAAALRAVDDMVNLRGALASKTATAPIEPGAEIAGVSLAGVDKVRAQIGRYAKNAGPEDARSVLAVRRAFDSWLDEAAETGLLQGTPEGLELFKAARKARAEYGAKFESNPRQSDAKAGRVIEHMLQTDVTPVEVANYLIGSAKAGERGLSVRLATRLKSILGTDSPEWGALRQATWLRMTSATADGTPVPGPEAVARRIREFATGKGEPFAQVLYTPAERATMMRFAAALEQTVTPRNVRNPSGSGYEAARAAAEGAKAIAAMLGGAAGGPAGALGARISVGMLGEAKGFLRARNAVRGVPQLRYMPGERGAIAGGGAAFAGQSSQ